MQNSLQNWNIFTRNKIIVTYSFSYNSAIINQKNAKN